MLPKQPMCFVLMPFEDPFTSYYEKILKPTIEKCGLLALRADDVYGTRTIMSDIWRSIKNADLLIADLTFRNPNVLYELGLSHAINKKVIIITQNINDIPFDLKSFRCIIYDTKDPEWANKLALSLDITIKSALEDEESVPFFKDQTDSTEIGFFEGTLEELLNLRGQKPRHGRITFDKSGEFSFTAKGTNLEHVPVWYINLVTLPSYYITEYLHIEFEMCASKDFHFLDDNSSAVLVVLFRKLLYSEEMNIRAEEVDRKSVV